MVFAIGSLLIISVFFITAIALEEAYEAHVATKPATATSWAVGSVHGAREI